MSSAAAVDALEATKKHLKTLISVAIHHWGSLSRKHVLLPWFVVAIAVATALPVGLFLGFIIGAILIGLLVFVIVELTTLAIAGVALFWVCVGITFWVGLGFVWLLAAYQIFLVSQPVVWPFLVKAFPETLGHLSNKQTASETATGNGHPQHQNGGPSSSSATS